MKGTLVIHPFGHGLKPTGFAFFRVIRVFRGYAFRFLRR
jgi:hypothetical protein